MHATTSGAAVAAACMRACVAACVIDTMYLVSASNQLTYTSARTQAWRIEFSYKDIRAHWERLNGRVRCNMERSRPFNRSHCARISLYENSIIHAWTECTFASGCPNIAVLIQRVDKPLRTSVGRLMRPQLSILLCRVQRSAAQRAAGHAG